MANQTQSDLKNKIIYLLRHGETDFNKNGMVQGRGINASLNDFGRIQAAKVFEHLKTVHFDHIYTSSLIRTQETVEGFTKNGISMESHPGFDEISWGDQEGLKTNVKEKVFYGETIKKWRDGILDANVGGGESPLEVMSRQKEAMKIVLSSPHDTILICMHGRAMRVLLCWLLNYPLNYMDGFPHENCSYYKLGLVGDTFFTVNFNEVKHLNG